MWIGTAYCNCAERTVCYMALTVIILDNNLENTNILHNYFGGTRILPKSCLFHAMANVNNLILACW